MGKKARLVVGIILMVLGVLSLMGLYLQTGMNLWVAFGVGLGASIFTIGLPCLGTFLIWGYKEKEKKERNKKEKSKVSLQTKDILVLSSLIFIIVILLSAVGVDCGLSWAFFTREKDIEKGRILGVCFYFLVIPFLIIVYFLIKKCVKIVNKKTLG